MNKKPISILIAEDNEDHAELTLDVLKKEHPLLSFKLCSNGVEVIDTLNSKIFFPDLILIDLKMPLKDGFDVLKFVKSDVSLKHIPTIILTTSDSPSEVNKAYSLGANSFLTKPFSLEEYKKNIKLLNLY